MIRKSSRAPEHRLYGSGADLYDPEVLPRTRTASLWFRRGTLWSRSPPAHQNTVSMAPARTSMIRKSSRAPEHRLYGSGADLYDPEVLPRTGTASLWFRRGTLWSGSPPAHQNTVSMAPARTSLIRKSSRAPEQRLYGSGADLSDPEVLPRTRTASLWFRRGTLWSGSPPTHRNSVSRVPAETSMIRKSSRAPEQRLYGSGADLYDPEVLPRTGTASLAFRQRTLWSGSPPAHQNTVSMAPARTSMIRKSSRAPEQRLYGSGEELSDPEVLPRTGTASLGFRQRTLWSGSPPAPRNSVSMVPAENSMIRKSSRSPGTASLWFRQRTLWSGSPPGAPELRLYGSGAGLYDPEVLHNTTPTPLHIAIELGLALAVTVGVRVRVGVRVSVTG